MQAAKAKRKSCEFWLSFTVWTEWSLNRAKSYLIAFAALRRIHRFRWCIEFHFKHWIIAVSDNCKVIVSQHFDPWNYNIRCQNLTHFSASLSTVKFVVWPRKVFFQASNLDRKDWGELISCPISPLSDPKWRSVPSHASLRDEFFRQWPCQERTVWRAEKICANSLV